MGNEKINILKLLIENQEEQFTIRKISQLRKVNYKSAYNAIKKLESKNIISVEKIGNTSICRFSGKISPLVFNVEYERRRNFFRNTNIKIIYNKLNKINHPFICLIFGSYVKGTDTKSSDIDLLLISNNKDQIHNQLSLLPLNLHTTFITFKEFEDMLRTKELTVVSEAVKKNIILIGIEDYYRILENAG